MKIDVPLAFPESVGTQRVETTGTSSGQNQTEGVSLSPDEVQLSVGGDKIQHLKAHLTGLPDMRQNRVTALKQAVDQGDYQVSDQQIAQAMTSDLLGRD